MCSHVHLIVAYGKENLAIGKEGGLMWSLPEDMRNFSHITKGNIVIMGRKTYESLPEKYRPLPGRRNVVLTRDPSYREKCNAEVFHSLEEALDEMRKHDQDVYIIGGGYVYKEALDKNLVDILHLSLVDGEYADADTFFPSIDFDKWCLKESKMFSGFEYRMLNRLTKN